MIACVQNVYENASSRPAAAPASGDFVSRPLTNASRPTAIAAQIAEKRFRPRAGLPALTARMNGVASV